MPGNTFGLPIPVDGPAPIPPALTLVGASRVVPTDDDRWIQGVAIWPYPRDLPDVFDACQPSSSAGHSKAAGTPTVPTEEFGAYNVLEGITCTTRGGMSQDPAEYKRRAEVALRAYEHWAIEREFWSAPLKPDNPHLAQAGTPVLNGGTATSLKNGIALLEQAIADAGGTGVIHMRVTEFSQIKYEAPRAILVDRSVARTDLGTIVVPGVGYNGHGPESGDTPSATVSWIYATGLVEHRQSEIKTLPDDLHQAVLRTQNEVTFRAERYVLDTFDQRIHVAVKIDRALTPLTI